MLFAIRNLPFSKWDEFFGNLSYGMFLNHFFCIYLLQALPARFISFGHGVFLIELLVMSAIMALASYYVVELPALHWRRAVRYRSVKIGLVTT